MMKITQINDELITLFHKGRFMAVPVTIWETTNHDRGTRSSTHVSPDHYLYSDTELPENFSHRVVPETDTVEQMLEAIAVLCTNRAPERHGVSVRVELSDWYKRIAPGLEPAVLIYSRSRRTMAFEPMLTDVPEFQHKSIGLHDTDDTQVIGCDVHRPIDRLYSHEVETRAFCQYRSWYAGKLYDFS